LGTFKLTRIISVRGAAGKQGNRLKNFSTAESVVISDPFFGGWQGWASDQSADSIRRIRRKMMDEISEFTQAATIATG
jgi:hypothetical protein